MAAVAVVTVRYAAASVVATAVVQLRNVLAVFITAAVGQFLRPLLHDAGLPPVFDFAAALLCQSFAVVAQLPSCACGAISPRLIAQLRAAPVRLFLSALAAFPYPSEPC